MASIHLSDYDIYLFKEGCLYHSYRMLGAHIINHNGVTGVRFAVWAPNAYEIRIVADFNNWQGQNHKMEEIKQSGIWCLFVPEAREGHLYKYKIYSNCGEILLKADPFAFHSELRPGTASRICSLEKYEWHDESWFKEKKKKPIYERPMNIYEVHLGSWKRKGNGEFLSYRELADDLIDYAANMGYTHLELMPVAEHPYDGSWGYQTTGYYSVTSRYGYPEDFMYFVDRCHEKGIGVILDWVPGHFCRDAHGLRRFDGKPLFEHPDPKKGENIQWDTMNFDLGRPEVMSFLISNAVFWLEVYHLDGIRVDAVASILYLDYGKDEGQWVPNKYGGNEDLEGINFLKKLNEQVFKLNPDTLMIAEESTEWPLVSRPTYLGGLGFNYKWNMGWMNDTLAYMEKDPVYRKWHHNLLTFSFWYAFSENFILPLSHDEVVHCKGSLIEKMPGDYWQKFANLRVLYGYMIAHPGKNLLFMGGEFAQFDEWDEEKELSWNLFDFEMHRKFNGYVRELNLFYLREEALWQIDHGREGFEWIDPHNSNQSVICFMRKSSEENGVLITLCNFTPEVYEDYRVGVPKPGEYREIFNSDLDKYGGSGQVNNEDIEAFEQKWHNQPYSIKVKIPPLAVLVLKFF